MLRIAHLWVPPLLLAAGCSESAEPVDEAQAAEFAALFERGFEEQGAQAAAILGNPEAQTSGSGAAGLPFDRSVTVTRRAEATVADNLAEDFSLRFALVDPAAFVRSGQVRDVYLRDLSWRNFPDDTVAGATALMFAVAWELANERKLSPSQNAAVLRQATETTRGSALGSQNDEARQAEADIALTVAGLWLEEARLREGSPERMQELSAAVGRDMMKLSGTDMRASDVTSEGVVGR